MPVARFEMPDGKVARFEVPEGTTPEEAQVLIEAQINTAQQEKPKQVYQDSFADDAVDVVGEVSAGANDTLMVVPNLPSDAINLVGGAIRGAGYMAMGVPWEEAKQELNRKPIPNVSDVVESVTGGFRPGQGGYVDEETTIPFTNIPAQPALRAFGQVAAPGGMAMTPVKGRNIATLTGATNEALGFGSAPAQQTARTIANTFDNSPPITAKGIDPSLPNSPAVVNDAPPILRTPGGRVGVNRRAQRDVARDMAIKRSDGNPIVAGFKLDDAGNVVKDAAQQKALKAGIEKRTVAQLAQSSPADKEQAGKMLLEVRRGLANKTYADYHLPREVLGDSLYGRYQPVRSANKKAGEQLEVVVESLENFPFDPDAFRSGPRTAFDEALKSLRIRSKNGKLIFKGSDLEAAPEAQNILKKVVRRMATTEVKSLRDVHAFKKFIDNMVSEYGKNAKNLAGDAEYVVKELRHNVNQYIREFGPEEYAKTNDIYSESIEALQELWRLIGKKNNPSPANLAKMARKGLTNYQNGDAVMDSLIELDGLARKYGVEFGDDIKTQVSIVNTIEKLFPSAKPQGAFSGLIDSSLDFAKRAKDQGLTSAVIDHTFNVGKQMFNNIDDKQIEMLELMEELVKDSQKIPK